MNNVIKMVYGAFVVVCLLGISLTTPLYAGVHGANWGYSGSIGPQHWAALAPEFAECGRGTRQSPVDINGAVSSRQAPIDYRYESTPLKILNNGHTVQVNDASASHALLGGKRYKLLQFHFHSPSENALNGKRFPMEVHLVHKDDHGNLAVIGVFMEEGAHNGLIDSLWSHVSAEVNHEASYALPVNVNDLLPANSDYYHFQGSLTTPPCSEGVNWYVLNTPIQVSKAQIQRFVSLIGHNARPLQPLNSRSIVFVQNDSGAHGPQLGHGASHPTDPGTGSGGGAHSSTSAYGGGSGAGAGHAAGGAPHASSGHGAAMAGSREAPANGPGQGKSAQAHESSALGEWIGVSVAGVVLVALVVLFVVREKRLMLKTRLVAVLATLLLVLAAVAGFAVVKLNSIGKEIKGIAEQDMPLTEVITQITVKQLEQAVYFERAMLAGETKNGQKLQQVEQVFRKLAVEVDEEIRRGEELAEQAIAAAQTEAQKQEFQYIYTHLGEIGQQHGEFDAHVEQAFSALNAGNIHEAEQLAHRIEAEADALDHELERFLEGVEQFTKQATLRAEHDEQIAIQVMMVCLALALLFGVAMGYLLVRGMMRQINEALAVARRVADGDLSKEINVSSSDEIGQLLKTMDTMQCNLKASIDEDRRKAAESGRIKTALDNVSGNVMVADSDHNIIYLNKAVAAMFREAQGDIRKELSGFDVDALLGSNIDVFHKNPSQQRRLVDSLSSTHTAQIGLGGRTFRFTANPVVDEQGSRLGTVVEWIDRTQELAVEDEVQEIVDAAQSGDLSKRIAVEGKSGFFLSLGEGINTLVDVSEQVINDTLRVLGAMSKGDLTKTIASHYEGRFGELKRDANATVTKLTEVMDGIKRGADSVSSGSAEISQGNTDLSQRTEEQAANLEETASSMEQMTATVKQNADNSRQANQLASGAREQAEKGGQVVGDAVSAMGEISNASKKIADIIGVIDEIAFQTNLLALNAAVEAARAGEQGRGFAVVASEVRNLAQRSATAAKEIKSLIEDSVSKVEQGSALVDQSGETLGEIVTAVKRVSDIIAEIAAASQEQSSGIEQVNKAIMQMDDVTQQNAALVEQAAAAAESMDEQARAMKQQMEFFKLDMQAVNAGFDFSEARSKHLHWKVVLRRFLDGKQSMSKDQAVSHELCDLGKWLYSKGIAQYGHMQEMQQLEQVHKDMHKIIHNILDFKHAGKDAEAEREYAQVETISSEVVSLLDAVENHAKQDAAKQPSQTPAAPRVERRSANRPWSNNQAKPKSESKLASRRAASSGGDSEWESF